MRLVCEFQISFNTISRSSSTGKFQGMWDTELTVLFSTLNLLSTKTKLSTKHLNSILRIFLVDPQTIKPYICNFELSIKHISILFLYLYLYRAEIESKMQDTTIRDTSKARPCLDLHYRKVKDREQFIIPQFELNYFQTTFFPSSHGF